MAFDPHILTFKRFNFFLMSKPSISARTFGGSSPRKGKCRTRDTSNPAARCERLPRQGKWEARDTSTWVEFYRDSEMANEGEILRAVWTFEKKQRRMFFQNVRNISRRRRQRVEEIPDSKVWSFSTVNAPLWIWRSSWKLVQKWLRIF